MALDALECAIRDALEVDPSELTIVAYVAMRSLRLQLRQLESMMTVGTGLPAPLNLPVDQIV